MEPHAWNVLDSEKRPCKLRQISKIEASLLALERYTLNYPDNLSARLRSEHHATLLAVSRGSQTWVNPPTDFVLQPMDDALVVAESLGTLEPLRPQRAMAAPA
jgi:K+/H+ antiporter YhaU regulatory subunit KhtT